MNLISAIKSFSRKKCFFPKFNEGIFIEIWLKAFLKQLVMKKQQIE